jgi:hypothetical protein
MFADSGTSMLTTPALTVATTGMERSKIAGYRPFQIMFAGAVRAPFDGG